MPQSDPRLRDWLEGDEATTGRHIWARDASITLDDLARGSSLGNRASELHGRSVLVATSDQLTSALALIELDGIARRLVLLPPDVRSDHLPALIADSGVDAVVTSANTLQHGGLDILLHVTCTPVIEPAIVNRLSRHRTEWVLFTSGTTNAPKMVVHSLSTLTAAIKAKRAPTDPVVWGTFYDIRRYGGLQIFFRAILDGGSLVLSESKEPIASHLLRLGKHGITHISGTPTHWRRVLMSSEGKAISPQYIRLSGEIADQAILNNLRAYYPQARIGHAYASTEAGVGFEINDGHEGFPASMIGQSGDVEMKVVDGSLQIRSNRTASQYIAGTDTALTDHDGFVDTGDMLELRSDRYHFVGRKGGIINVGGLKVHPEEIEAVINQHPSVRMSLVRSRRNPITGSIVVADVILKGQSESASAQVRTLRREILEHCRAALPQHKVPVVISFVSDLTIGEGGKLARHHA
jgi:acyl-coenzyme A synthetase/AMP-(fatty) acid ligase